jgi:DNA-damage-inducible protein J
VCELRDRDHKGRDFTVGKAGQPTHWTAAAIVGAIAWGAHENLELAAPVRCNVSHITFGSCHADNRDGSRPPGPKHQGQATETLAAMGLSVSDAVRVFLTRVAAEKRLPFALKVPNSETRAAMDEADAIARARRPRFKTAVALFDGLEKNRVR